MSVQAITWAFDQQTTPVAKFLLVTLANYANEHGQCWPSKARLARMLCCDERTVHRNLHALSEAGLITIQHRYKDGVQLTSIITLLTRRDDLCGDGSGGGAEQEVGAQCQGGVGALNAIGGGTAPHRTVKEPKRETILPRASACETLPGGRTEDRAPSASEAPSLPERSDPPPRQVPVSSHELHARLVAAAGECLDPLALGLVAVSEPIGWLRSGADLDQDVIPIVTALGARARRGSIRSWSYFAAAVSDAKARRERGLPAPSARAADPDPYMPAWKAEKLRKAEAWRAALRAKGYLS